MNQYLQEEDLDDENYLREYRERRLNELRLQAVKNRFGDVLGIGKDDWIREVTESSNANWVVVHLFQDSVIECQIVEESFIILAKKFKYVKFVKIRSTQAIENWPDKNLPAIFCYHEGILKKHFKIRSLTSTVTRCFEGSNSYPQAVGRKIYED